jgi:hypothetical protein
MKIRKGERNTGNTENWNKTNEVNFQLTVT